MDAGYKVPAIAHLLFQNGLTPVFPYKRPMSKKGFSKNTTMFTMTIMIFIFAQITNHCPTVRLIDKAIGNTKVILKIVWYVLFSLAIQNLKTAEN
jgi:hypothetical protein